MSSILIDKIVTKFFNIIRIKKYKPENSSNTSNPCKITINNKSILVSTEYIWKNLNLKSIRYTNNNI